MNDDDENLINEIDDGKMGVKSNSIQTLAAMGLSSNSVQTFNSIQKTE